MNGKKFVDWQWLDNSQSPFEFNAMLNALKVFGHLIKKLKLKLEYHYFNEEQSTQINKHLSQYLADSLIEIELNSCDGQKLNGLTRPFKKTETVYLRNGHIKTNNINLSEIFPVVRRLSVASMLSLSPVCIEQHFHHLMEMNVEYLLDGGSTTLKRRLQLNPQLRNLTINGGNWMTLKLISETVPALERLDCRTFNGASQYQSDNIHFEHLKSFEIVLLQDIPDDLQRIPLVFDNLEEIKCYKPVDKWFEIVIQNKNLKKVTVGELTDQQFERISAELPKLEEFVSGYDTNGGSNNGVDNVVRFMENGKMLRKVKFFNSCVNNRNAIVQRLPHWKIVQDDDTPVFVRQSLENDLMAFQFSK